MLAEALKRTTAGEGREVVLVSGEAGLGKSTVAAEAARRAHEAGACVLLGHCDPDLTMPYEPFVDALSHYVTNGPEEVLVSHVEIHGGELGRLVPAIGKRLGNLPAPQSTEPDTERYLLFAAVVGLLAEVSAARPLVLVLDDLQWADKPSLQLFRHLVASTELPRVLVVATYRDSELSRSHPLLEVLGGLRREPAVSHIDLKGLDDSDVIAFVEAATGHDLDAAGVGLAHALYRETDGNPFFVGEVLRDLAETGAIYQEETGRWSASGDLADMDLPDPLRLFSALDFGSYIAFRAGQFDLANKRLAQQNSVAERLKQPRLLWTARQKTAAQALSLGDVARAEQLAASALDLGTSSGEPDAFGYYGVQLMKTRYLQGQLGEVVSLVAEAVEHNPAIPAFGATLATARLEAGDDAGAKELIDRAAGESFSYPENPTWFDAMVATRTSPQSSGSAITPAFCWTDWHPFTTRCRTTASSRTIRSPCTSAASRRFSAGMKKPKRTWRKQRSSMREAGCNFAEANTDLLWGRMLRTRGAPGDVDRARELLEQAIERAATNGYSGIERRAVAELSEIR